MYKFHLYASTHTDNGPEVARVFLIVSVLFPRMVKGFRGSRSFLAVGMPLHVSVYPVYGYYYSRTIPESFTYYKAHSGHAPLHPLHPYFEYLQQSTNCCSEKLYNVLFFIATAAYNDPVVENDQHEPHDP